LLRMDLESQSLVQYSRGSLRPAEVGASTLREAISSIWTAGFAGARLATRRHLTTHDILIQNFAKSIRDGVAPAVTLEEGRESIRVLDLLVAELDKQGSRSTAAALAAS